MSEQTDAGSKPDIDPRHPAIFQRGYADETGLAEPSRRRSSRRRAAADSDEADPAQSRRRQQERPSAARAERAPVAAVEEADVAAPGQTDVAASGPPDDIVPPTARRTQLPRRVFVAMWASSGTCLALGAAAVTYYAQHIYTSSGGPTLSAAVYLTQVSGTVAPAACMVGLSLAGVTLALHSVRRAP